jgi:sec-independent protein translocase protein TatB
MFNIGGGELIVIMLIALIVLGPQRLPDAARQIGKAMADLRRLSTGFQTEVRSVLDTADDPKRMAARRNPLAKDASAEPTPTPSSEPSTEPADVAQPVRTEPLVAGPPMERRNGAATPPGRTSAQARAAAKKSATQKASAAKRSATQKAAAAKKLTAANGAPVQKATEKASAAEPADEASTEPTKS